MLNLTKLRTIYDAIDKAYDRRIESAERRNYGKATARRDKALWHKTFRHLLHAVFGLEE